MATQRTRRATTKLDARAVLDAVISEETLQNNVIRLAKLNGYLAYHTWNSRHSTAGFPDLVLVPETHTGPIIFAELKREKGRVSVAQSIWLRALQCVAARCPVVRVYVWRPSDWPIIEKILAGAA